MSLTLTAFLRQNMSPIRTVVFDSSTFRDSKSFLSASVCLHLGHNSYPSYRFKIKNARRFDGRSVLVGTGGIEPPTPSTSRKCSPTELRAFMLVSRAAGNYQDVLNPSMKKSKESDDPAWSMPETGIAA